MKKIFTSVFMLAAILSSSMYAQDNDGYQFTTVKEVKISPVKNQNRTGTCWCFSGLGFLESELLRMGKGEYDLSEMFIVNHSYKDKADKYVRLHGYLNFAQGGSAFGAFLAVKDKQMKSVASSAALSAILGITEPAMYGVNLKYRKPFAFAMVSSAISAAFLSFFHAGAMAYAPPGLFTIITYQADSFVFIILGAAMSFAIAAVLTFLFGVPKESKQA